jgi:hypothetical protein
MYCRFLQFGCKVTKKNKKRELQRKKITVANTNNATAADTRQQKNRSVP